MKNRELVIATVISFIWLGSGIALTGSNQSPAARTAGAPEAGMKAVDLYGCNITVLSAFFWRDWMPIVEHPGSDHGSPLLAKVKLLIENTTNIAIKLSFKGSAIDDNGRSYPLTFRVQPSPRLAEQAINEASRRPDEQGKKEAVALSLLLGEAGIEPGQTRELELISRDGPYLPVGSRVHVEFAFTDQQNRSVIVKTRADIINRTD